MKLSLLPQRIVPALNTPLLRTGGALIASSLASSGLGFLYWVVAARMLNVAEVGMGSAIISTIGLIATFSICGLNFLSSRFLPTAGALRLRLSRMIQMIAVVLGAIGGTIFIIGSPLWAPSLHFLGIYFVVATALWTLCTVQDHVLLGIGQPKWIPLNNSFSGMGKLVIILIAVSIWKQIGWEVIIWPWVAIIVIDIIGVGFLIEHFAAHPSKFQPVTHLPSIGHLTRFALANHIGALLLQLPPLLYPILILHLLGQESVAYFYTCWMIANLVMLSSSNIASAMVAQVASSGDNADEMMMTGLRYAMFLAIPAALALVVVGKPILLIFGTHYQSGYSLLLVLAVGTPIYAINSFYAGLMRVRRRLTPVIIQGMCAGSLALSLALPLGAWLGLVGFGVAFVAGQCLSLILILPTIGRMWWKLRQSKQRPSSGSAHLSVGSSANDGVLDVSPHIQSSGKSLAGLRGE